MSFTPETTTTLSAGMPTYFDPEVLSVLRPSRHFGELTTRKNIPENAGKIISFLRYTRAAGSTTALTEGTAPNSSALTTSAITATLSAWGRFHVLEDFVVKTVVDDAVKNAQKELMDTGLDTIDLLIRNQITAGGTNFFANGKSALTGIASGDTLDMTDIRKVQRALENGNVPYFKEGRYHAVIHPYQKYDLAALTAAGEWNDIHKYTDAQKSMLMDGEMGEAYNIRFMVSTNCLTTATGTSAGTTAYYGAVAGRDAIASVSLKSGGGRPVSYVKEPEVTLDDPIKQFWIVSLKIPFLVPKVLEQARVYNLVSAATQ